MPFPEAALSIAYRNFSHKLIVVIGAFGFFYKMNRERPADTCLSLLYNGNTPQNAPLYRNLCSSRRVYSSATGLSATPRWAIHPSSACTLHPVRGISLWLLPAE